MSTGSRVPAHPSITDAAYAAGQRTPSAAMATAPCDDGLSAFVRVRPRLFGIAYRMLRSMAEAEDVVQDVWVRWQTTDRHVVRDVPAFLATTTTRLAINVLQSARARRETTVGSWLPEPVDLGADPGLAAERDEAVDRAVRRVLETLSPAERAAYVLREVFNHRYQEIAETLRVEAANARQLVTRAREHLAGRRRAPVSRRAQQRLLTAFVVAAKTGDLARLERVFASDVGAPGGSEFRRSARRRVAGRQRGAELIAAVAETSEAA